MRERDFYQEPDWDWFPPKKRRMRDNKGRGGGKANENPPLGRLGQMALVLALSLGIVLVISLAVAMIQSR
jgi:hypothetical protein